MHEFIDRTAFVMLKREQYCKDCAKRKDSNGKTVYHIGEAPCRSCGINDVLEDVEDFPPSAVRPMVRGAWEKADEDVWWADERDCVCSACGELWSLIDGTPADNNMHFCPNCGAKMEG